MQQVLDIFQEYNIYITAVMAIIILLLFIMVIVLFNSVSKVEKRYRKLMRGINNKNLEELINTYLDKVDSSLLIAEEAREISSAMKAQLGKCIQKFAVIRYKAFEDVGSDLSFSIALLDDKNDGIILTGIYARYESTTYAKPIDKGISRYDLSEEEEKVLKEAINK